MPNSESSDFSGDSRSLPAGGRRNESAKNWRFRKDASERKDRDRGTDSGDAEGLQGKL